MTTNCPEGNLGILEIIYTKSQEAVYVATSEPLVLSCRLTNGWTEPSAPTYYLPSPSGSSWMRRFENFNSSANTLIIFSTYSPPKAYCDPSSSFHPKWRIIWGHYTDFVLNNSHCKCCSFFRSPSPFQSPSPSVATRKFANTTNWLCHRSRLKSTSGWTTERWFHIQTHSHPFHLFE